MINRKWRRRWCPLRRSREINGKGGWRWCGSSSGRGRRGAHRIKDFDRGLVMRRQFVIPPRLQNHLCGFAAAGIPAPNSQDHIRGAGSGGDRYLSGGATQSVILAQLSCSAHRVPDRSCRSRIHNGSRDRVNGGRALVRKFKALGKDFCRVPRNTNHRSGRARDDGTANNNWNPNPNTHARRGRGSAGDHRLPLRHGRFPGSRSFLFSNDGGDEILAWQGREIFDERVRLHDLRKIDIDRHGQLVRARFHVQHLSRAHVPGFTRMLD